MVGPMWMVGALLGALGVALGAFGAHALKSRLEARGSASTWELAVRYHMIHAMAVLVAQLGREPGASHNGATFLASLLFVLGVAMFSGSLYGLALGGPRWLGPVTPLGGLCLIAGWVVLGVSMS